MKIKRTNAGKKQKEMKDSSVQEGCITSGSMADSNELELLKQLVRTLDRCVVDATLSMQQEVTGVEGPEGLKRLATAMTILLIDLGNKLPESPYQIIVQEFPDLCDEYEDEYILALCEEIQQLEIPEQSALLQETFGAFNTQYFAGRLPKYRITVVYDVCFWKTKRCGYPRVSTTAKEPSGFVDFNRKRIFLRFLPDLVLGVTMPGVLLHEMAHAATGDGHGENWQGEMSRLKLLGAPVDECDVTKVSSTVSGQLEIDKGMSAQPSATYAKSNSRKDSTR